jgi:hypothetical protein
MKPIGDYKADQNLPESKGMSIRHEYPVNGQAMLASATAVQNACVTHMVDMSGAAEDATRLFCQITWRCSADKQDQLVEFVHRDRERAAAAILSFSVGYSAPCTETAG